MTLPLTRLPRGDAGRDACPPDSPGPPWWRGRSRPGQEQRRRWHERGRQWRARAISPRGAAVLLAVCALFACAVTLFSTNPPERLWGIVAAGPYGLAAVAALAGRRGPRIAVAVSLAGAVIVPLAWMAWSGRGQPEVSVVIHSASLFLHQGTPYQNAHAVASAHNPYIYNPYLPALAVFGVPHALFGGGLLTDPRVWFGVVFVLGFAGTLALNGVSRPWLWTAVVTASPIIAFPLTTGGDDLPVLALICVGLALLGAGRTLRLTQRPTLRIILAGLVLGLAAAMKATAWPALAVAFALVAARDGKRAAGCLACATIAVPIAVDGPVLIAQPAAVVSNTILFPLGLTKIKSPAASFLPGYLIAQAWGPGHLVAIALVLLAGLGVAASLVLRPPQDERSAGWRLVTGLVLMFALAPASRFGYGVYPLGLACWLLLAPAGAGAGAGNQALLTRGADPPDPPELPHDLAAPQDGAHDDRRVLDYTAGRGRRSRGVRGGRGAGDPGERAAQPHRRHVYLRRG
jgi:Glycosyltransferase family 87